MFETKDRELLKKSIKTYTKWNLAAATIAILGNVSLNPLTGGRCFEWPKLLRYGIRSAIWILPLGFSISQTMNYYSRATLYIEDKYGERIIRFMRTGDPSVVNPDYVEEDPYAEFTKK